MRAFLSVFLLVSSCLAADLQIAVSDPQNAAIQRARVAAYAQGHSRPLRVQNTAADGTVRFTGLTDGQYDLEILAPGFAVRRSTIQLPQAEAVRLQMRIAAPGETVEVSATRTALTAGEAAVDVNSLGKGQLEAMLPVNAADTVRFLPGAVVNNAGRFGGLGSLFVRGGDSRYNKVIIDGVPVNEPGGTFNFSTVSLQQVDRVEFVRGAASALYGSDAMTSVVQLWTANGTTRVPQLTFGADGGNFATAHGFADLAGARGRFDYKLFADQFNSEGQGVNDEYSNATQGGNVGVTLSPNAFFRLRARHSNARGGVQSYWNFNGQPLLPPETDEYTRQNDFLASADLILTQPARWQHRFSGFEYNHVTADVNAFNDFGRLSPLYGPTFPLDLPFQARADINRAGFEYQGEYWASSWARSIFGYHFEDENGWVGDLLNPPLTHGLRRNHAVFGEQVITWRRLALTGGLRFEHIESFGDKAIPRFTASVLALRGGNLLSGTRLRFTYAEGIKEPRLEETFASGPFIDPNPGLKPEQNRSFDTGVQQGFAGNKYQLNATYFHNEFTNQIAFKTDFTTFRGSYVNVNQALAHGVEITLHAALIRHLAVDTAYTYTASQVLQSPFAFDPLLAAGQPLLRRPKHSGTLLATWLGNRWGASLEGTFVGRRTDSDFVGFNVTHAAGYGRIDLGAWRAITPRVTAYFKLGNAFDRQYEEAAGYPALGINFRGGVKFRIGGE